MTVTYTQGNGVDLVKPSGFEWKPRFRMTPIWTGAYSRP